MRQNEEWQVVPRLRIPLEVWLKMMAFIVNCQVEINGFGFVSQQRDVIHVDDVFILEQSADAASVETDPQSLSRFVYEMVRNGGDPGRIRFQWHSHVDMAPFWSPTDQSNIEDWPGEWLVSLVANRRGEYLCRIDTYEPRLGVSLSPGIYTTLPAATTHQAVQEIADKVRRPTRLLGFRRESAVSDQLVDEVGLDPSAMRM